MKYPWVAISLIVIWIATAYVIIKTDGLDVNYILLISLTGTVIISLIGFRAPRLGK